MRRLMRAVSLPSATGRYGSQNFSNPIGEERVFQHTAMAFSFADHEFDKNIAHLSFITGAIKSVKADGAVLEIGVGGGGTSIVINKFMEEESINRPFYANRYILRIHQRRCRL
jgi:hypothetical protein